MKVKTKAWPSSRSRLHILWPAQFMGPWAYNL